MNKTKWKRTLHPLYKDYQETKKLLPLDLTDAMASMIPKYQWIWKQCSIISPSGMTSQLWEAYNHFKNDIERFDTFNKACQWCEKSEPK